MYSSAVHLGIMTLKCFLEDDEMKLIFVLIILAVVNSALSAIQMPAWATGSIYWMLVAVYWFNKMIGDEKDG